MGVRPVLRSAPHNDYEGARRFRGAGETLAGCSVHKLVADALVVAEGKALLVKYKDTAPYDGQAGWFIPDDFLRDLEHPADAASRILKAQVGIKPPNLDLGLIESFGGGGTWHLMFHYVGRLPRARAIDAGPNVAEAKWFALGKLPPRDEVAHHGWARDVIKKVAPRRR